MSEPRTVTVAPRTITDIPGIGFSVYHREDHDVPFTVEGGCLTVGADCQVWINKQAMSGTPIEIEIDPADIVTIPLSDLT